MKRIITLFTALALILSICLPAYAAPASAAEPTRASATQTPVKISAPDPTYKDESFSYAERAVDLVSRMTEAEMISQTEGYNSPAIARLGVATYMWWNEALHGYNQEGWFGIQTDGSSFPSSYSMGCSWDPEIYYQEAVQIGAEIRERVKQNRYNLTMFSPTINLGRDPRWGRNDEGYGEDPFVTGTLASSFVKGVEGKTIDGEFIRTNANGEGVKQAGTTIKHYAANNSEKNRYTSGADNVTVREMREYYTRAARIVTRNADVSSVMMAYSSVSGFPISFSSYYMDTVLRQTYGFSGYIVSDCDSVAVSYNRSVHKNNPHTGENYTKGEAFANALANGLDLQCNAGETDSLGSYSSNYSQLLAEADGSPVKTDKGYFTKQQAEVSVARLMTQRMKLGEFDEDNFYAEEGKARLDAGNAGNYVNGVAGQTQERIDLADDLSRATIVLLQNENKALPITAAEINAVDGYDVAIIGPVGQSNFRGGYSSTLRNEANVVTIEQAIKTAFADSSYYPQAAVDNVNIAYYYGFSSSVNRNSFTGLRSDQIAIDDVAEDLDLAIVVVGQGNGDSREDGDRTDLNLAQAQIDLLKAVKAKNPKKLILVMETYGPVQMVSDLTEGVDAILWSGFNGFRKGTGFGEAITGKNNPSGRMNATWLKDMINDTPGFFDYSLFPNEGEGGRTYMYNVEETIYPFGFGLSYSDFQYVADGSILGASAKDGLVVGTADDPITKDTTIDVSFQIKNNSAVAGKQVAEVYVVSPGAGENDLPLKRLVGFDKVEVGANATVDVTIPVQVTDFGFFDEEKDCYELPTGTWQIWVAFSSDLNEATDLVESFTVQNGAIREDPVVVSVKPTQPGDDEKGISERVIFDLTADASKNIIDPGVAVTMTNEKLYGVRVVKNVPGEDIGVDPDAATEAGGDFSAPDTAASLPRLQAGKSADELPHVGTKFVLPDSYQVEYSSNRPEVVAVENGQFVMKGIGVATLTVKVTAPSGEFATEEFTVGVETEPGLESISIGETKYKKFDPENYGVNVSVPLGTKAGAPGLEVNAVATEGATVEYLSKDADGNFVPNESRSPATIPGTVYVRVTGDGIVEQIYEVNYAASETVKPANDGEYVIAASVEPGKQYVIVANREYALTNRQEGPALRTYAGNATTTLASAPVVVSGGKIISTVSSDMVWTVEESTAPAAYDGETQYFLKDSAGNYLRRGSGSSGQGAQLLVEPNLYSTLRYNTWSFRRTEGTDPHFAMYANSERAYGTDYPFYVYGNETSFDSPGRAQRDPEDPFAFVNNSDCSQITLYEYTPIVGGGENIDFTNPADEPKYEVMNPDTYALAEGTGVTLTPTADAFEPVSSGCGGSAADSTPKDLIRVPVVGDWTATVCLDYNQNGGATASSTYYAFMGMAGDNYQDLAGIRGTGTASQDFLRQEGVTMDSVAPGAGFTDSGLYWVRLQKEGTNYTASISTDGAEYTELFTLEDTGVEAEYIVLDAYKTASSSWGSSATWLITLKSLTFGEGAAPVPAVNKAALKAAIADANAVDKSAFTADSVAAMEAALAAAEAVRDNADATQDEVDDAADALNAAIAALIKEDKADTTALEAAIAAAEVVERGKYTDESLAAMDAALAEARTALAESRLQAVIDTAAQALNDAIAALVEKAEEPEFVDPEIVPIEHPELPIFENTEYSFQERAADLIGRMNLTQKASEITSQSAPAISAAQLGGGALNVPATKGLGGYTWWSETLHGTRGGVNYPQNTTVASTWNPDLYYQESTNIGQEIRERNNTNLNFYSPTINMHRDPRWGRNEESYSEDVYLTAQMGIAWVQGLEGKDREGNILDPDGYLMAHATIKHYVANNNEGKNSGDTTGRLRAGAISSLRMLREYYALPYGEIIRGADVSSVMTAYNYFGVEPGKFDPSSYSSYLMDTLLRQVYGFNGHITSDCDSVCSMQNLHYVNYYTGKEITAAEAMAGALAHGEDLECNGGHSSTGSGTSGFHTSYGAQMNNMIGQETDKGIFTENTVDISLHRLMTARFQTGDFDGNIQIKQDASARNSNTLRDTVRRPLVEQINDEGVVMLQNKGILPLDLSETGVSKIAIVGSHQTSTNTGLYAQASGNQLNIQRGITDAINAKKAGVEFTLITSNNLTDENRAAIEAADVAIVVTGTTSGYSAEDRDRASIILPDNQETLISTVGKLNPNTIAIMETCGPMRVHTFQDDVNAILWSSFGGQWKNGFGDIIAGKVNPSGKVTDTWYQDVADTGESDVPPVTDYDLVPSEGKNGRTYMYYNGEKEPSYVFGYGLSYTTFEYSNLTIDKTAYDANETVKVSFNVKNTGSVAGKETTQLYIAQPDAPAELKRPIKRLKGFDKIELQPGESKTVEMEVKIEDLGFFDEAADCFLIDQGRYQVQVGTNSAAAANLTKDFTVSGQVTEVPAVLTVKANQAGDTEQGIEQRLIYDKNKEVNPQVTVSMNNEKLYGYIIAQQHSNIKSMESTPLPEGMKLHYFSNRPEVVKVEGDKVYTVGPGVATLTVTAAYNGVQVSGDAIIYVMTSTDVEDITVNGETIEKFSPKKYSYSMTVGANDPIPVIGAASSNPDLDIVVTQAEALPGEATVVSTDRSSGVSSTYTIKFKVKASNVGGYILADTVEAGKQYVIVSNGYALTNEVASVSTAYGGTSLASTPVTVENDMIVSGVTPEMIWDFNEGTSSSNNGFETGYWLTSGGSMFLARNGPTNGNPAPLDTHTYDDSNYTTKPQYCYWVVQDLDEEGNKAVFCTGTGEWSFALRGSAEGFDAPGNSSANTIASQNPVKLYEVVAAAGLPNIDFTTEADSGKYELAGQTESEVVEGEGLALIARQGGVEPAKQSIAEADIDVVKVPVSGDWTATLTTDFETNGARNGYYQFFAFFASQGGDNQNMVGIRGGDGAMQDFIRKDGAITEETQSSSPGFATAGTYYLRIEKDGDKYTCYRSDDGEDFTEMFSYEDTGIEADEIIIDAYTGMTEGYKFTLKSLEFEGGSSTPVVYAPEIASITVDGADFGFDPAVYNYNIKVERGAAAPVVAAVAGNKGTKVEIQQIDAATGTATVVATAGARSRTYTLSFNYQLASDYFADGDYAADQWTIINKDEAGFSVEKGKGIVMPTQTPNVYQSGSGWKNAFATPAMSNWEAVVKVVYPVKPEVNYQQAQILLWQDEDNYLRLNCQSQTRSGTPTLIIEPGRETNGSFSAAATSTIEAAEDNTVTLYFKFKKDGNDYTGAYSLDGSEFTECLTATGVSYVDPQLVLFSSMNEEGDPVDTYYEYVYVAARDGLQPDFVEMLSWAAQNAADYIAADLPAETAEDLVFAPAPHGYTVAVSSSDPAVIAADGKVTPAEAAKDVTVTVTVTEGDTTASASKVVRVPGTGAPELNTTALEAAIAAAEAIDRSLYTDESLLILDDVLAGGKKALEEATDQFVIDNYVLALNAAVAGLELKPVGPEELKLGPNVVKDPESPTGYTVKFLYDNDEAESVTFNGDIMLRDDVNRGGSETYTPFEYRPGLMRAGGWSAPMEKQTFTIDGEENEVWYIEVPLACGANQYWFTLPGSSTMIPDPANTPIWSPTATQRNGYNYVYVPYDEKQNYEPMKAREAELPRTDGKVGQWGYVPIEIGGTTHHMGVYTPYGYVPKGTRAAGGPYKLIFVLHGYGQDESDWMNIGSVQKIMDNLAAEGRTEPAVIVSVTTNNNMIGGTGDNYANLMNVIIPYLEENYNIATGPENRAFCGLSMGAMNTMNIINGGADRFAYYAPMSGGMSVRTTAPGLESTHIMFGSGWSDTTVRPDPNAYKTLTDEGYYAVYEEVTGGHDFNAWCQLFRIFCEQYAWNPAAFGDTGEPVELDTAALEAKLAEAQAIDTTPYTNSSAANLAKAIAAAQDALETAKAQRKIDEALANLENAIARLKVKPSDTGSGAYVLADEVEPGKSYVIVADDAYALGEEDGALAAAEVTVSGDKITSAVTPDMVWTFQPAEGVDAAADENAMYFITDADGNFLRRSSSTLSVAEFDDANARYFAWSLIDRGDDTGSTFYANSSSASSRYAVTIDENGVTSARVSASSGNILASGSPVKLYEMVGSAGLSGIDFTDPADASKYDIVNKDTAEVVEGTGITLTPTADAFEPIGGGFGGGDATPSEPKDLILVPVNGDWTGVLQVVFDQNEVGFAFNSYFAFLAMAGDDYQNMVGIRGTNNVFQDYLRQDGTIAASTVAAPGWQDTPTSGFTANGTYFLKLEKEGETYIGSWSADGVDFTELFRLEDTGIEAEYIVIDAYKTSTFSFGGDNNWLFTLKNLDLEGGGTPVVQLDKKAIRQAIRDAKAIPRRYYLEDSLAIMDAALAAAEDALANATTQDALDAAAAALNAAIAGLERNPNLPKYNVTFDFNFPGAPDPVVVQVEEGKTVEPIEAPARAGYAFSYWGTERSSGWGGTSISRYDFATPITGDLTLKASWTKDWNQMYSLAEEYADYFPFGNFGTMSPSTTSVNQVTREYNTYSGNSGKMTYNFGANQSKAAYDAAVAEINARTDISDAEKAELIKEADGKVLLGDNNPLESSLNNIRAWNEAHPEGPKKYYRQHVLFWHGSEQNAAFYHEGFDTSKPLASKEVMNARIDSYVEVMFKRYQEWDDVILSWDVVNEALDDYTGMVRNGWNGSSWGETMLDDSSNQSSAWGTIYRMKDADGNPVMELSDERLLYESEWIREAFASAKKWKEELGVHWTLYYNDYMNSSMLYEPKVSNTLKMLKPISDAGNLEGYGMQARLATAYPDAELLRWQIEEGLKLAPEVSFSEGDVRTDFEVNPQYDPSKPTRRVQEGDEEWDEGGSGSWSRRSQQHGNTYDVSNGPVRRRTNFNANDPEIMREQADYYADLMDIMLEKADLGKVGAIAIDGTSDSNTFNSGTGCQIWDSSGNEKPAFYAVIGAPNRHKMGKAIEAGPAVSEELKYTPETWAPYAAALAAAEALVDVRIYDADGVEAVKAATAALIEATENLELASGSIPEDLEELYRLARQALARAQAAQQAAEEALAAAQAAGGVDTAAIQAAQQAAEAAQAAAQQAAIAAAAAQAAAAASDVDAAQQAAAAARDAAYAAEQAAAAARAQAAAQRAQAAAEAAQAAAEAAEAMTAADKTAVEAAKKAAEDAKAAAEAAKAAAEAADLEAAERAAASAASAAEAARALQAAQAAQAAAEAAQAAALAAQAKAEAAEAQAGSDAAEAAAAKAAAEAAKQAAENAKAAAEAAKAAAAASDSAAADAAASAAASAAQVAAALQQVAAAQAEIAEIKAKAEQAALEAAAALAAAEAAQRAAEAAELNSAKYLAKAKLAAAAAGYDVPEEHQSAFNDAAADGRAAIDAAADKAAVDAALEAALKALADIVAAYQPPFRFDDVTEPEEQYYFDPVYWAYEREPQITNGTSEKLFSPDLGCTRAQVVTFLWRAANQPEPKTTVNPFEDVATGAYYYKAVLWAAEEGITNGTSETTFDPEKTCTRAQIVTFLWRYFDEPAPKSASNPFKDVAADAYYCDAVLWAAENNITRGVTSDEFRPDDTCTRAQVVTFLYRAMP